MAGPGQRLRGEESGSGLGSAPARPVPPLPPARPAARGAVRGPRGSRLYLRWLRLRSVPARRCRSPPWPRLNIAGPGAAGEEEPSGAGGATGGGSPAPAPHTPRGPLPGPAPQRCGSGGAGMGLGRGPGVLEWDWEEVRGYQDRTGEGSGSTRMGLGRGWELCPGGWAGMGWGNPSGGKKMELGEPCRACELGLMRGWGTPRPPASPSSAPAPRCLWPAVAAGPRQAALAPARPHELSCATSCCAQRCRAPPAQLRGAEPIARGSPTPLIPHPASHCHAGELGGDTGPPSSTCCSSCLGGKCRLEGQGRPHPASLPWAAGNPVQPSTSRSASPSSPMMAGSPIPWGAAP